MSFEPLFKMFCNHMRERGPIAGHVLLGSACELWAVAEACACINAASPSILPPGICMVNENQKRDAVLWEENGTDHHVHMAVEAKVVYPNKNLGEAIRNLEAQLCRQAYPDEVPQMPRYGLVLAIWDSHFQSRQWPESRQFFTSVAGVMRSIFSTETYCLGCSDVLQVLIPQVAILRGKTTRSVALAAGYVECLRI